MFFRIRLGSRRLIVNITLEKKTKGFCSKIRDRDEHILMWDFDNLTLKEVEDNLKTIQYIYRLPPIYIVRTSDDEHYHAYCFKACPFETALQILTDTKGTDKVFIAFGILRGYWTLRFDRSFRAVSFLDSVVEPDVDWGDLENTVEYWTKGGKG
jgi:hypothetical protein